MTEALERQETVKMLPDQLREGYRVRVADLNLVEGYPEGHPEHELYRAVCRVELGALLATVYLTGDHWGTIAKNRPVRVHKASVGKVERAERRARDRA